MQSFIDIPSTDSLQNSRLKLINNDKTIMSCHSGTLFPTSNLEVGMLCFRTDLNQVFELKNLTPSWILVADLNKTYTNKEYVDERISNHGNHVPTKETLDNKRFLRNDNTWQTITPTNIGAAATTHTHNASDIGAASTEHTHTASQILELPTSLPASGGNAETLGGLTLEEILNMVTTVAGSKQFNTAGTFTFTIPDGVTVIYVTICGGGGGGGGGSAPTLTTRTASGGGGGSGGLQYKVPFIITPGETYIVTVGAGGAGGTRNTSNATGGSGGNGGSGGTSSFGTLLSQGGGGGGRGGYASAGLPDPSYNGSAGVGATNGVSGSGTTGGASFGTSGKGGNGGKSGGNGTAGNPGLVLVEW